jgi:hypothetical protein
LPKEAIEGLFEEGKMTRAVFLYARSFGDLEGYREARKVQPYFGSEGEHERQARTARPSHLKRQGRKHDLGFAFRLAAW